MPEMVWALLCVALAAAIQVPKKLVPALDPLIDVGAQRVLPGSNFELEDSADIKVSTAGKMDFATAPATQFWRGPSYDLIVAGGYRELNPVNNGVYFYMYWITRTQRQPIKVQFRAAQDVLTPLDIQVTANPITGFVELELWQCFPLPKGCVWGQFNDSAPWQMDPLNVAYFSYNNQIIPGSETSLPANPAAPAWFLSQQTTWASSGIGVGLYGKLGIDLRKLPCYASQTCADWDWVAFVYAADQIDVNRFENGYCSHIEFEKSSAVGNRSLANAVFGLYLPYVPNSIQKGAKVGQCTTDANGKCSIKTNVGQRVVYEDVPPPDYLPIAPFLVTVPENGAMIKYPLKDKDTGSEGIKIQKVSGVTGQPLSGATFLLRQHLNNGTTVEWKVENASSTFCTDYPPAGSNWKLKLDQNGCVFLDIVEEKPPIGFKAITILNATFCITAGKENCTSRGVITVKDLPTPKITLRKVGDGGVSIAGTVLGLSLSGDPNQDYNAIPSYAKCTITSTSTTGSCTLYAPTLDTYYVVEVKPAPRYKRAPPQGPFAIVDGGTYDFTVTDPLICYGAPTIRRLNCDGTAVDLLGSVYQVTSGNVTIVFANTEGYSRYCFANGTDYFPMDDNCCADYTITELTPPPGLPAATPSTKTVHYCGDARTVPSCDDRPIDLTFETPPCYGVFRLNKLGPDGPVPGARFRLWNTALSYSVLQTVDSNGYACWTNVPKGTHSLQETFAPAGYVLDSTVRSVNIQPVGNDDSCENPSATLEVDNNYENFYVKISKKRQTYYGGASDFLSGAEFRITRTSGGSGTTWSNTVVIGATGTECVQLPSLGTYSVIETKAPPGFDLGSTDPLYVTITDGNTCDSAQVLTFYDNELTTTPPPTTTPAPRGTFRLNKLGPDGPVPGAIFVLSNTAIGYSASQTVDSNGYACWTNIPKGTHSLQETFAPPGFLLDTTIRMVTINPTGSDSCESPTQQLEVDNNYEDFYVKITKLNQINSQFLVGAVFTIARQSGGNGLAWTKDVTIGATGTECVKLPSPGSYEIKETGAPTGFDLSTDVKTVVISDGNTCGTAQTFTFYDTPVTTTTPVPTTTPTPTTSPPSPTCAIGISVYGLPAYYGGGDQQLPGATLRIDNGDHVLVPPFTMGSYQTCQTIPLGDFEVSQTTPPSPYDGKPWITSDLPYRATCGTASTCSSPAVSITIHYHT